MLMIACSNNDVSVLCNNDSMMALNSAPLSYRFVISDTSQAKEDAEAEDRRARGLAAVGHCDACGKLLVDKRKAFSRFEFRYCSSDCANLHKRKLAADAAERRLNGGT